MKLAVFTKRLFLYLVIGFVVILIWWSPEQTAAAARDFIGTVWDSIMAIYGQISTFLKGLGDTAPSAPSVPSVPSVPTSAP